VVELLLPKQTAVGSIPIARSIFLFFCFGEDGMYFEVLGPIANQETFAAGRSIRELPRLIKVYGNGRWRKRKGVATVRLAGGLIREAEVHWYGAAGLGTKELKIKRYVDS
jgi:hypothetical protein